MRTKTVNLYTYDELSDKAKARARDWFREIADDSYYSEYILEDFEKIAGFCGWTIAQRSYQTVGGKTRTQPQVYWTLSYSQGDGACFVGTWYAKQVSYDKLIEHAPKDERLHRIGKVFAGIAKSHPEGFVKSHKRSHHYEHSHTIGFEFDFDPGMSQSDFEEAARDLMDWLHDAIRAEHEYRNADEQVAEDIIANEYTFTADGKRED